METLFTSLQHSGCFLLPYIGPRRAFTCKRELPHVRRHTQSSHRGHHDQAARCCRRKNVCCAAAATDGAVQVTAKTTKTALRAIKKDALADILRSMQLSDEGLKADLVERLHAALQAGGQSAEGAAADATMQEYAARGKSTDSIQQPAAIMAQQPGTNQSGDIEQQCSAERLLDAKVHSGTSFSKGQRGDGVHDVQQQQQQQQQQQVESGDHTHQHQHQHQQQQQPPPQCRVSTGLAVQWLGTSSGAPTQHRNVSCILFMQRHSVLMVDCGEGTINQLAAAGIDPILVKGVFITHTHGDHIFGLPGLLRAISQRYVQLGQQAGTAPEPIQIFGPPGVQAIVDALLQASMQQLAMPLHITEYTVRPEMALPLTEVHPGIFYATEAPARHPPAELSGMLLGWQEADLDVMQRLARISPTQRSLLEGVVWHMTVGGVRVTAAPLVHRLPCWGYVFQEPNEPAGIIPERLQSLVDRGVPATEVEDCVAKQRNIVLPSGQHVTWQLLMAVRPGRKAVLLGDTCNSTAIIGHGFGADVLSHEATFSNEESKKAEVAMHSTAGMAGAFARQLDAKQLVLTHFSGRYKTGGSRKLNEEEISEANPNTQAYLAHQARMAFGVPANSQRVRYALDFFKLDVPRRQPELPQPPKPQHSISRNTLQRGPVGVRR